MGRSAKTHKRAKKNTSSAPQSYPKTSIPVREVATAASKKAKMKTQATKKPNRTPEGHVLGGADYVTLMMGSRRKAMKEAMKLPVDEN